MGECGGGDGRGGGGVLAWTIQRVVTPKKLAKLVLFWGVWL